MGIGFVVLVIGIYIFSKLTSKEYPDLSREDSINEIVSSVGTGRGSAYVIFEDNKKYHLNSAQNFAYKDFPNLSEIITSGDRIIKKEFSDTLTIRHSGKEYIYVMDKTIGR